MYRRTFDVLREARLRKKMLRNVVTYLEKVKIEFKLKTGHTNSR